MLDPQQGMSIYLIWAYHMSSDAQPTFLLHDKRNFTLQELIPAVTPSPTPSKFFKPFKEANMSMKYVNRKPLNNQNNTNKITGKELKPICLFGRQSNSLKDRARCRLTVEALHPPWPNGINN